MLVSKITEADLTPEIIDRLLFRGLEDTGGSADWILVLGSMKAAQYRVPVAAEAHHRGRANKMLLCGGKIREFPEGKFSEAEHMYKAALMHGVKKENIFRENHSQNTVENIQFALLELHRLTDLKKIHSVLLVTTAYHMRRSYEIARNILPQEITIIPCPANDNNTKRDNWMRTPDGIDRTKAEAMKIIRCINNGVIPDFEI